MATVLDILHLDVDLVDLLAEGPLAVLLDTVARQVHDDWRQSSSASFH